LLQIIAFFGSIHNILKMKQSFFVAATLAIFQMLAPFAHAAADEVYDPLKPVIPPTTVTSLNLTAYLGRWYQTHTSAIPLLTFEKDGYCVIADHTFADKEEKALHLVNSMNKGSPTGPLKQATGDVFQPKAEKPGRLVVNFDTPKWLSWGFYWIHKLGPIDPDTGLYEWSSKYFTSFRF
jgi:lipocalin